MRSTLMTGINRNIDGKDTCIIARYSGSARIGRVATVAEVIENSLA